MRVFLDHDDVARASEFIHAHGRNLERRRLELFLAGSAASVRERRAFLWAITSYQNADGGFGRGLESDFLLPDSSPLVTAIALRLLHEAEWPGLERECQAIVRPAISYLERTFAPVRQGWWAVPPEVNRYPHAPWWHSDEAAGMTVIDRHWGNPTAELVGYLYRYYQGALRQDLRALVGKASQYLLGLEEYADEHEIYCFIRLYWMLPEGVREELEPPLQRAVRALMRTDPAEWAEYVPRPLDFAPWPELARPLGITAGELDTNLDYVATRIREEGGVWPNWSWDESDGDVWPRVQRDWAGQLMLGALLTLERYHRIRC